VDEKSSPRVGHGLQGVCGKRQQILLSGRAASLHPTDETAGVTAAQAWIPYAVAELHAVAEQDAIVERGAIQDGPEARAWTPDEPVGQAGIRGALAEQASIPDVPGASALSQDEPVDGLQDATQDVIQDDPAAYRESQVSHLLQGDSQAGRVPDQKHVPDQKAALQRQPFQDGHDLH
jgi:hypothetical protein